MYFGQTSVKRSVTDVSIFKSPRLLYSFFYVGLWLSVEEWSTLPLDLSTVGAMDGLQLEWDLSCIDVNYFGN